jgi:amino acid transporter
MCALLGLSIIVLVVPGLFAIRSANYSPFFTHGVSGLALSFIPLFFSYAGFESLAQTAGETKDSTRKLPLVFLRGIGVTALIFVLMSVAAFGVLPLSQLQSSTTPMTQVAMQYLPWGAATFVTLGAIMAITTSLNPTLIVPSRLALIFVEDGLAPAWVGSVNRRTATPIAALTLNLIACLVLLISRQLALALNIAVFALVLLYFIHSVAFLLLPRFNPDLNRQITIAMPVWLQRVAAWVSVLAMGGLVLVQIYRDGQTLLSTSLSERISAHSLTSVELAIVWSAVGVALYLLARVMKKPSSASN